MAGVYKFTVENGDLSIRFSCMNHDKRIAEIVKNLAINPQHASHANLKEAVFSSPSKGVSFHFNEETAEGNDIRHEAVFFENTEYPVIAKGKGKGVEEIRLRINDRLKSDNNSKTTIISEGGELYGSLNFHNQVGMTDFTVEYRLRDERGFRELKFTTEVLSYKLNYRSDLRTIISDIEREYAMLSSSFLKDTYLNMRSGGAKSNDLIWWQIFRSCYNDIVAAARRIIDRPKRRLRGVVKYERAERLRTLPREAENEYQLHRKNPAHLYRTEEMVLSHDTIENRFLKYALKEMLHRFLKIKEHILVAMRIEDPLKVGSDLQQMEDNLLRLVNNPFFRGVGNFKGFSQDNLVMKQAQGYKTILEKWVELRQGYELEQGLRKLEVKEISELYEIWCFIKVKNIVQKVLADRDVKAMANGRLLSKDFIPQLIYGGSVSFIDTGDVELASVSYNVQTKKTETHDSAIKGTRSMTTEQRPDIVLRLTKTQGGEMKYTYLFDAKYRIADAEIDGFVVPPSDAIDQMHRYRDAIYYTQNKDSHPELKKEIIAGYVLFPGKIPEEALDLKDGDYYYQKSNREIGIGAFPLRPATTRTDEEGNFTADPYDTETALTEQIKKWLNDRDSRETLLETSIPQKGLEYTDEEPVRGCFFLSSVDTFVNGNPSEIFDGKATEFISGYAVILSEIDFQKIRYFAPVAPNHVVSVYYKVDKVDVADCGKTLADEAERLEKAGKSSPYKGFDRPYRIRLHLKDPQPLRPFIFGLRTALKGTAMTRAQFREAMNRPGAVVK